MEIPTLHQAACSLLPSAFHFAPLGLAIPTFSFFNLHSELLPSMNEANVSVKLLSKNVVVVIITSPLWTISLTRDGVERAAARFRALEMNVSSSNHVAVYSISRLTLP
jgi:hypothetical protein